MTGGSGPARTAVRSGASSASSGGRRRLAGLRPSELHPIYPAMVMGTGSLSTGALLLGWPELSVALFVVALAAFAVLVVLAAVRLARFPDRVREDFANPRKGFAPFTFAAALGVLGTRLALDGHEVVPWLALAAGLAVSAALVRPCRRMLVAWSGRADAVTGNWQLPSVAIEALALLAAVVGAVTGSEVAVAVAVALWLVGTVAYVAVVPRMVRRFRRLPVRPADLTPDYWTLMAVPSLIGLVATRLWAIGPGSDVASWFRPVYQPVALVGVFASVVLTPLWVALQVWCLVRDASARRYSPPWWGLVFPTAIVVVAARVVGVAFGAGLLRGFAGVGFWLVLGTWGVIAVGLLRDVVVRRRER